MLHRNINDLIFGLSKRGITEVVMRQRIGRFDRIASEMNAWLLAVAIGLGMLDLTVLVAKSLPPLPPMQVSAADTSADHPSSPPSHETNEGR